ERLPIPFFGTLRLAELLSDQSKPAPGLCGCRDMTTFGVDPGRLHIVLFGFIPLLLLLVDPAQLMTGGGLHFRLVELLKELPRRVMARERLFQLPFRQGEGTEPPQFYGLAPEVFQFLGDLQRDFVRLPRVTKLPIGAKRFAKLGSQPPAQAL